MSFARQPSRSEVATEIVRAAIHFTQLRRTYRNALLDLAGLKLDDFDEDDMAHMKSDVREFLKPLARKVQESARDIETGCQKLARYGYDPIDGEWYLGKGRRRA